MNIKELSQIKEEDVIYDKSVGIVYNILKVYKSGVLAYWKWTNSYGRFSR